MKLSIFKLLAVSCIYLGLTACASRYGQTEMSSLHFYSQTPADVSSMWDDGQNTYIVPKRNVAISKVSKAGVNLKFNKTGAYYVINGTHADLQLEIDGEALQAKK